MSKNSDLKSKGIEGVNNDSKSILEELLIKLQLLLFGR